MTQHEQQKLEIQFVTEISVSDLFSLKPLLKQINKGSLAMSSLQFSSVFPPQVNRPLKQINEGAVKHQKVQLQANPMLAVSSVKCFLWHRHFVNFVGAAIEIHH